ncbi:hypothetical protein B0H10DRAFT_186470 [Mycena sp. CBHHK59/15]|nr:hypothetical protein B0H10DRAFT_186470 [Mycena sp. CBHHK59/15]
MPALRTRDTHPAGRSLEVSTAPPPPTLTIISPTPRAFTFPIAHNLSDSPYSSPGNSPFEPDLRALALSADSPASSPSPSASLPPNSSSSVTCTPPPLSAFTRTLSPAFSVSPSSAPASPASGPVRRKSTSAAQEERRPKKGDEDYVKRPENAFILFRRKCCEERALSLSLSPSAASPASSSTSASSASSSTPSASTAPSSAPSSLLAGPNSADSPALAGAGKKQRQADLSKTISAHASAPTPPPYQAIQIPNVYFGAPDGSPTDASLLPMISRRAAHPGAGAGAGGVGHGGFDYMPSFAGAFEFEASLQSSDFLRAMFPAPTTATATATAEVLSPASSASGSGPSSPYTPAEASFHPSAFSAPSPSHSHSHPHPHPTSHAQPSQLGGLSGAMDPTSFALDAPFSLDSAGLGLGLGLGLGGAFEYTPYASAWAAASANTIWGSDAAGAGAGAGAGIWGAGDGMGAGDGGMGGGGMLHAGDFDIGAIPGSGGTWGARRRPLRLTTLRRGWGASGAWAAGRAWAARWRWRWRWRWGWGSTR